MSRAFWGIVVTVQAIATSSIAMAAGDPQKGRSIVASRQQGLCLLCHSAPIPEERFQGNLAPNLVIAVQGKTEAQLRQAIEDPSLARPGTIMPSYYRVDHLQRVAKNQQGKTLLNAEQIDDVLAYLITLKQP
jgi:sulfur-oxidizing protein SoxX